MPSLVDKLKRQVHELRHWIKWTVYTLLLINFGYYIWEDWVVAAHTLRQGGTLFDWTASFANSIDETAWFILLALFELETYVIPDEAFTPAIERTLHAGRIVCYVFLAHTIFAYAVNMVDLERKVTVVPGVDSLCELTDQEISFTSTMKYTLIDAENCGELSDASEFYQMVVESVVTDARGLAIEKELGWVDLIEGARLASDRVDHRDRGPSAESRHRKWPADSSHQHREGTALRSPLRRYGVLGVPRPLDLRLGRDRVDRRVRGHRDECL